MNTSRRYDVIVIGSGIGGLTAALTAANAGLGVLVLEAGKQFGGYTNPFKRGRYSFDPGLHYIGECGPGQQLTRILETLGLADEITFRELSPDGFDRLVFPGYEVAMPAARPATTSASPTISRANVTASRSSSPSWRASAKPSRR